MGKKRKWYIVSVKCQEVRYYNGEVAVQQDETAWLGWDSEYQYPSVFRNKNWAHKFKEIPTKDEIARWDGMPWYFQFIPDSEQVFLIEEETFDPSIQETEVTYGEGS